MPHNIYTTSEKAWTAMLESITQARSSIYLESYIFLHDTFPTHNFVEVLAQKAREGLRVVMVIDGWGSYYFGDEESKLLKDAGVELLFFTYWFRRIHRKVLVIDDNISFLGGVNIANSYVHWLDLHIKISGKAIVQQLLRSFAVSYRLSGGKNQDILLYESRESLRDRAETWILEHRPKLGGNGLQKYYEERLNKAEKSIVIVSPYFLPGRWFIRALRAAMARGVRVEVLLPKKTSPAILTIPNILYAAMFFKEGVHFYFNPVMNHGKALLIDDKEGLIGSQNIDAQSFDFNAEVGVSFTRKDMVSELREIIETWKQGGEEFTHDSFKKRWYHKPLEFIARALQPVM